MPEKKEKYKQKIESQLREWEVKIKELKARGEKLEAEAKIKYYEQLQILNKNKETAENKFHELKESGEGAWKDAKKGLEKTWKEFKKTFKAVKKDLSKQSKN